MDTATATVEEIRHLSNSAFKDHVITERMRQGVFRSWRCQRPGSWVYGFDITTVPGSLIITGDIGDLIVTRMYDMLPWCRGSVDSTSYFAEKVPHAIPTRYYSPDRVRDWVQELVNDAEDRGLSEDQVCTLNDLLLMDEFENHRADHWYKELSEFWDGGDPPSWRQYTCNFLWCRDAIRWFVNNHDEPAIEVPDAKPKTAVVV